MFSIDETSAGLYCLKRRNTVSGANLGLQGEDPEELIKEALRIARDMDQSMRNKVAS